MCIRGKTIIKHSILAVIGLLCLVAHPTVSFADYVKVKGSVVNVRQGPGTTFPVLFQAEQGEEFTLVRTEGLWCQVTLEQGKEAWVFRKLVSVLPGQRPGEQADTVTDPEKENESGSLAGKVVSLFFLLMFIAGTAVAVWKRKPLLESSTRKLREISGYRREQPFRYDNRKPNDDSWEL